MDGNSPMISFTLLINPLANGENIGDGARNMFLFVAESVRHADMSNVCTVEKCCQLGKTARTANFFSKLAKIWLKDVQTKKMKNKKYRNVRIFASAIK